MSKGLDALDSLMANYYEMCRDLGNNDDQYQRCNLTSEKAIIENELKDYEKMKTIKGTTTLDSALEQTLINSCPNVAKKLKALEIIKNRKINIEFLNYCFSDDEKFGVDYYNAYFTKVLTQEQYELLKEVLCKE